MYFGIDLGTSNSAICGVAAGQVKIFKTPEGTDTMPSIIHRDRRGNQTVGVRAFDQASLSPDNAVDGFKRQMGTDTPLRFASTGDTITPEQAATEIIRALVGQALVESGTSLITGAVVTIPAAFNQVQSEATLEAARAAGLDHVALLQEPVAAALAAMAGSSDRNGLFLVYDLGGGTFDAALVHAIDGEVTVLAHEGVSMLGGRDLDRRIMESVALPWLKRNFDLPSDFAVSPKYNRLVRMARRAAESAKIVLSTKDETTISASDDEIRLEDLKGEAIYLDVPLTRSGFEVLATDMVTRSIDCCRAMIAHVGYRHEDIARVVLIGGPTKMPFLRRKVQDDLGIQVEDITRVDPMTAVAVGAAIYCEGRNWSDSGSTPKPTRTKVSGGAAVNITFDYEVRTASSTARLQINKADGEQEIEVLIESFLGWSTGRRKLVPSLTIELPLKDMGPNKFKATVFNSAGLPILEVSREIVVERLLASTGGVPATHTITAKILDSKGDKNILDVMVEKGTILPASGVVAYRLAAPIRAGGGGKIRIELYEVTDLRVREPHLNRLVGEFQIGAEELPQSAALRKGDEVRIHWWMSEGQEITAAVELPSVHQRFDQSKFYNWQMARQNFAGEEGAKLASTHLGLAERELESAEEAVPPSHAEPLVRLRDRLEVQVAALRSAPEPDVRRQVVEEARLLRQEIAIVCQHPDAKRHLLRRRLNAQRNFYDRDIRTNATAEQADQVEALLRNAAATIDQPGVAGFDLASDLINQVHRLYWVHGFAQDGFCVEQFKQERDNRHLATDPMQFDRSVSDGNRALISGNIAAVRVAYLDIMMGQVSVGTDMIGAERASLMKV